MQNKTKEKYYIPIVKTTLRGYLVMVKILSVLLVTSILTACGTSCEQDGESVKIIETSENPYPLFRRTTDLDIQSARWENRTTGEEGVANVYQDYGCILILGCGTLTHIDAPIYLAPGLNQVQFYEDEGDCEWEETLEITLK